MNHSKRERADAAKPPFRFRFRTYLISLVGMLTGLGLMMLVSWFGILRISDSADQLLKLQSDDLTESYLTKQMDTTAQLLSTDITAAFKEQAALAEVLQAVQDHPADFHPILEQMSESPYFKDSLSYSGRWYQNSNTEPGTVLVQQYLLNADNGIPPSVYAGLKESLILDWVGLPFYRHGTEKLWLFYTGGEGNSFMRVYPWSDVGNALDAIYPEHTTQENWEAFNPGLLDGWKRQLALKPEWNHELWRLAVAKPPSQDGATGKTIITLNHPIFNASRQQVTGSMNMDLELTPLIDQIQSVRLGTAGFAYLMNSDGVLLAISPEGARHLGLPVEAVLKTDGSGYRWLDLEFGKSRLESVRSIQLPEGDGIHKTTLTLEDTPYYHFQRLMAPIQSWSPAKGFYREQWTLGFIVPQNEYRSKYKEVLTAFTQERNRLLTTQIAVAAATLMILGLLLYWVTRRQFRTLMGLRAAAQEISAGNFALEIPVNTRDEVGSLADSFRQMQAEIQTRMTELSIQNERLKEEISTRELREQQLVFLKQYDPLTNLPNQTVLLQRLTEWIHSPDMHKRYGSLVLLGLDDFRKINETFSHKGGDSILLHVTERLLALRNQFSFACRVGGDEFLLVYHLGTEPDDLLIKIEEIFTVFERPFVHEGTEVYLTACIGICSYPLDGTDPEELLKNAITALNHAKDQGKGSYHLYDAALDNHARRKRKLATALRKAIDNNEMRLVYQPIVELSENRLVGFEALIRWHHPEMGTIMPSTFIPLAEETGLIISMGNWVLYEACRQLKEWQCPETERLTVSVNISSLQFKQPDFVNTVKEALLITGLPPHQLNLELTEGLLVEDVERVREMLSHFRDYGIELSIDDFGTGYSSLNYIRDFPMTKLKIDRSFIRDYPSRDNGSLAKIVVQLCHTLGIIALAEGIETAEQLSFLKNLGCHEGQGYYFNAPLTPEEACQLIRTGLYSL